MICFSRSRSGFLRATFLLHAVHPLTDVFATLAGDLALLDYELFDLCPRRRRYENHFISNFPPRFLLELMSFVYREVIGTW